MRYRAFSLIEVLTTLVLIGIIAAIALPRYSSALCNYRVSAAARRLAADLHYAHILARASSSTCTISFNTGSNSYQFSAGNGPVQPGSVPTTLTSYSVSLQSDPYCVTMASVSLSNATSSISFNGYGLPSTGGTIILQCGTAQKTITIDSTSGAIGVQ